MYRNESLRLLVNRLSRFQINHPIHLNTMVKIEMNSNQINSENKILTLYV